MIKIKYVSYIILSLLLIKVFKSWFALGELASGDAPFFYLESIKELPLFPYLWQNQEIGNFTSQLYPFFYLNFFVRLFSTIKTPWLLIERILWYWPFLGMSIFSSWFFIKTALPGIKFMFFAPLIYLLNSYILMIIGGGQISIALSYALAPLVISIFIKNILRNRLALSIGCGLILALQLAFEPRIAALTVVIPILYSLFVYRLAVFKYFQTFLAPLLLVIGTHFYWILPTILLRRAAYATSLSSPDWLSFLSFADFSKTTSLLHPNWPENIFGKVYFMKWEFLILPIVAYSSLFFINSKFKREILFFAFLGLIGAFLAKGTNPPFGEIYTFLFKYVPGINLFRDSTKFYLWVALSYSILIPFSVNRIYEYIKLKAKSQKSKEILSSLFLILTILYLILLIKPAFMGELGGTFKSREVPKEYMELKNFLSQQPEFFRTFWIPQKQRFGFYSNNHPAISAQDFFKVTGSLTVVEQLKKLNTQDLLAKSAVKYIILPYDSEEEMFLKDRRYDETQRLAIEKDLDQISWLKKINYYDFFRKITIYEVTGYRDHFWLEQSQGQMASVDYRMINPTKYLVSIKNVRTPSSLIFSETFDNFWQAKIGEKTISSGFYNNHLFNFNSFEINETGDFEVMVEFIAQKYVNYGLIVSGLTLLLSLGFLIIKTVKLGKINF